MPMIKLNGSAQSENFEIYVNTDAIVMAEKVEDKYLIHLANGNTIYVTDDDYETIVGGE